MPLSNLVSNLLLRQEAEFRPTKVLKVAGSAPRTNIVNGWAYLVDWEKNGKADDESSDLEAEATDPSLPQEASSFVSKLCNEESFVCLIKISGQSIADKLSHDEGLPSTLA